MAPIRLRDLEVFNAVMQAGKVTEAARVLHVSQAAISKTIRDMEASLKLKLFDRSGRRLVPSDAADILFREVSAIFNRLKIVGRVVNELQANQLGNIVIAAGPTLAHTILPDAVANFRKKHPQVGISIRCMGVPEVVEAVASQEADLGLTYNCSNDPRLEAEAISTTEIGCVMRRDHPLASKAVIEAGDFADYQLITYAESSQFGQIMLKAVGQKQISKQVPMQVTLGLTACYLAKATSAVSLVDTALLAGSQFPELTARPFRPQILASLEVCTAYGTSHSHLASSFIEELKALGSQYSAGSNINLQPRRAKRRKS